MLAAGQQQLQTASNFRLPPISVASICKITRGLQTVAQVSHGPTLVRLLTRPGKLRAALLVNVLCMSMADTICRRTDQEVSRGRLLDEDC